MRSQKKSFWITLILTIICLGAMIPLFLILTDERPLFYFLRVVLSGLSTGLLVAMIMSVVFHRNEKDKYMKKLYSKARSTFLFYQQLTVGIDDTLSCFDNKDIFMVCAENCKQLAVNAMNSHGSNPLYSEEYMPLFARKSKPTKMELTIDGVTAMMNSVIDIYSDISRFLDSANAPEYKTNEDRVALLFPIFNEYKGKVTKTSSDFDLYMTALEKKYSFDYAWIKTTKLIDNMIKANEEQRKAQYRYSVMNKINSQRRNKEVVSDMMAFLPSLFTNPDIGSFIKSLEPILQLITSFFPKPTRADIIAPKGDEGDKMEIIEPSDSSDIAGDSPLK